MMHNLYSDEFISSIEKKKKRSLIIVITIMSVATLLNVGLLFLSNEYNKTLMEFILSFIYVVSGWVSLYFLLDGVIKSKNRLSSIKSILSGDVREKDVVIKKINKQITLSNSLRCYEIVVLEENRERKLYYDELFDISMFKEEESIHILVSNNFIIGCEVKDEIQE